MFKSKSKTIVLILLILNVIMGFVTFYNSNEKVDSRVFADVPEEVVSPALPSPTPQSQVESSEMVTPDGKATLTMKRTKQGGVVQYLVTTSKEDGSIVYILDEKGDSTVEYSIPFNAWSPDNTYLFLEKKSANGVENIVFRADGEQIREGEMSTDVTGVFYEKIEGYAIEKITGWASPTLLIANTVSQDRDEKASFWIEIPSKAVIRLGTYFE